ncbi:Galactokinase [Laetiporus sulphureus 93-53]|uniref:Galactokinase n=1 Tax=Laetiporus sulphureus 93-53 TaxID=1314785 RepID=A0A165C5S5_9APHY|nr:Galactokinase [Laetiporus sulphureus 93-53]KZT02253.1 Galactokinase [Laetiporus sulphureus 93-53]
MAAELPIPVYTTLNDVLGDLQTAVVQSVRWNGVVEEFEKRFGRKPAYIARAPGRVNLIGDHIDYVFFGVLPAAIEHDILIACGPSRTTTTLSSSNSPPGAVSAQNLDQRYVPQSFTPMLRHAPLPTEAEQREAAGAVRAQEWFLEIDKKELRWESYVKAGYYGVLNRFFSPSGGEAHPVPIDLLVTGSVPSGSGLSSSAAMVVASTLAFLAVNNKLGGLTKGQLVEMAMENEKRVGVNSGGMDQAASVMSTSASALYITFFPALNAEPVLLPTSRSLPRAVFVCANSLVVSDKVVGAKTRYNLRVVETLVAARVLAYLLGISVAPTERPTLREVLGRWLGFEEAKGHPTLLDTEQLKKGLEKVLPEVERLRPRKVQVGEREEQLGVTMEEMIDMSGLGEAAFQEVYLSWVDVEATHFQLYKRTKHVFEEALRVLQFREICLRAADAPSPLPESTLIELGALMDASHRSASTLCENSCPEVDELVRIAKDAGAYGSRITGAGWGGCTVSLVAENQVEEFIQKMKAAYPPYQNLDEEALKQVIFATKPSSGACVLKLEE